MSRRSRRRSTTPSSISGCATRAARCTLNSPIAYQVACHQRVQNIGLKTRDVLQLVPGTAVTAQERCSGHDGTYAIKQETRDKSIKIARPVVRKVDQQEPDHFMSDCPMAATHIANLSDKVDRAEHPMTLLRMAYGL